MINFKAIKYKNILSTGNAWTEIRLNENKSTLIVGENGAGKSTMLDAICFALYGKAFRKISKPQLINSINQKGLLVELVFNIGAKEYLIRRGIKPNVFEIWCDDVLINQDASARDYQAYLEENILKLNYKSFGQVVVLGSSTFVPFMQLPAKHRREVVEDLLDIQIFTTMNTLLRERILENKDSINEIKYKIDLLQNKIESAKSHNDSIRKMREKEVSKLKEKLREQIVLIENEQEAINEIQKEIGSLNESISDKTQTKKKQKELEKIDAELSSKLVKLQKDIQFYENHDNCPTCKQGIEHDFKDATISDTFKKIKEIQEGREKIQSRLDDIETRISKIDSIENQISEKNLEMSEHNASYRMAMDVCKSIRKDLGEAEKEVEEITNAAIENLKSELKELHNEQIQLFDQKELFGTVSSMLRDGGIKTRIVKQYVPIMNKLINKYLAAMDFFVQFELDENFDETIKSRFRDVFSYDSFSEGEKLRINLALLFTWRAVSKLRNSVSTNLLIMDEIMDSSLDSAGTDEFLKIINDLTSDSNIFIISHKGDQLYEKFDSVLRFQKVKNFSQIAN